MSKKKSQKVSPPARATAAKILLTLETDFADKFAFNNFSQQLEVKEPLPWDKKSYVYPRGLNDDDGFKFQVWLENNDIGITTKNNCFDAIQANARDNGYHPLKDWLDGLVWDKKPRLSYLVQHAMKIGNDKLSETFVRKWLLSGIHRIYKTNRKTRRAEDSAAGFDNKVDHVLCLFSGQGFNKSLFLQTLCGRDFFLPRIPTLNTRDGLEALNGIWIGEISEGEALENSSNGSMKAAITSEFDKYRKAYARFSEKVDRSCIFALTYNPSSKSLMTDDSGGRRYWIVMINAPIDTDWVAENREQIWAEIKEIYMSGEAHWLEDEADIQGQKDRIEQEMEGDTWETYVLDWLANSETRSKLYTDYDFEYEQQKSKKEGKVYRTTMSEILEYSSLKIIPERQNKGCEMRVSRILSKLHWTKKRETIKNGMKLVVWTSPDSKFAAKNSAETIENVDLDKFNLTAIREAKKAAKAQRLAKKLSALNKKEGKKQGKFH